MSNPFVTVALCTWNRAHLLSDALTAFTLLEVPPGLQWELLVVNNNSTDDTPKVIDRYRDRLPIRSVFEPKQGKSHACNRALVEAKGNYLAFTDDDVLVDVCWLASLTQAVQDWPQAGVFGGPIQPTFIVPPDPLLLQAFPFLRTGFCGLDHDLEAGELLPHLNLYGANMVLRRDVLQGRAFNTDIGPRPASCVTGEDIELVNSLRDGGVTVVWYPPLRVRHQVPPERTTLAYLKRYYQGYGETTAHVHRASHMGWFGWPIPAAFRCLLNLVAYSLLSITSFRLQTLERLRQYCYWLGVLRGCLRSPRQAHADS